MDTTKAPVRAITRELLEDRYDGVLGTSAGNIDTEAGLGLLDAVGTVVERMARVPSWTADDGTAIVVDELMDMIRGHIIRRVDELGIAR